MSVFDDLPPRTTSEPPNKAAQPLGSKCLCTKFVITCKNVPTQEDGYCDACRPHFECLWAGATIEQCSCKRTVQACHVKTHSANYVDEAAKIAEQLGTGNRDFGEAISTLKERFRDGST